MISWAETIRRFLVLSAIAGWIGGVTVYALVVIPVGHEVLRNHVKVGFITEKVTVRLNWIGVAALAILFWNALYARRSLGPKARQAILGTWLLMSVLQTTLFFLHHCLQRLLDHGTMGIIDEPRFYALHRVYLIVTTAQWAAALAHVLLALGAWRLQDQRAGPETCPSGSKG